MKLFTEEIEQLLYEDESYKVTFTCPRFVSGEAKGQLK